MSDDAPDKLSIVVFSGSFTRVHYALVMASGALAVNRPVTLFFTMAASRALLAGTAEAPGWHGLDQEAGGPSPANQDALFAERGVATFEELLEACVALEARFIVCEMGLQALGLNGEALRADVPVETAGVVTFLSDSSRDGASFFI